jgi:Domain of unknown function (DUF5615)
MDTVSVFAFLTDNNVPDSVGRVLEAHGHDVVRVREIMAADSTDPVVAQAAISASRILVTWDKDFNHQKFRQPRYAKMSRIGFSCPEPVGAERLKSLIDLLEFSLRRAGTEPVTILIGIGKFLVRC